MIKPLFSRALVILADGARPDVMADLIKKGKLPHIERYLIRRGTFKAMTTVFPSTTGPAYLPYLTGCYPGTCNVPGIRWFDKDHYAKKGWSFKSFRSYVGLETFLMNSDMKSSIKTAFDLYPNSFSIFNMVNRGIKRKHNLTRYSRIWYLYYAHLTDHWSFIDSVSYAKVIKALGMNPDFIFVNFPAIDEYSHRSSPFHARTLKAYEELDLHVGGIVNSLRERNMLESTLITLVSDHGLSDTQSHFDVGPYLEDKGIATFFYTQIFKFKFKASTMVSGNGMCHVYFEGQNGWKGRVYFEELSKMGLLIDEFRLRPEIALVSCQGADKSIHVFSDKGHGVYSINDLKQINYQWTHQDPLGIFNESNGQKSFSLDESYKLSFNSHFPDVFMQLQQVFTSTRSGDIILSARAGSDLRIKYENPEHKASHGALCDQHMKVPFIMNYPIHQDVVRSVDVFPTMLKLTGRAIPEGIDGVSLV